MSGPCQCNPGLSSGLVICLVGPGAHCNNTAQAQRPETDLFAFIHHSDPTKVRVGERNLTEHEVKLLKMTEGRTVSLNPPVTVASGDSSDSIDKMFDEGSDADQEHLAQKDDDVLEEVVALDASEETTQPLPPPTDGKSLTALRGMIPEGSTIPSDTTGPLITASVTPISDVGPVDSVSGLNLQTRPPHVRYVVSSDSSHHSASYSEVASIARSPAADVLVVTVAVTTTVDANKPSISLESFYASRSLDTEDYAPCKVLRWKVTIDYVLDSPYVCHDMTDHLAPPALFTQLHAMDYDQLYFEFNIGAARQVCLGAEVRMRAEHTLERKGELEDKCAEQTTLLSEKDAKIAHLKSLLSLKEAEAAEAISLRRQLSEVEVADATKSTELRDLKEKNFALEGER
ncbi:hypothetical protein Tco_0226693 [Tanacetum coccineum]